MGLTSWKPTDEELIEPRDHQPVRNTLWKAGSGLNYLISQMFLFYLPHRLDTLKSISLTFSRIDFHWPHFHHPLVSKPPPLPPHPTMECSVLTLLFSTLPVFMAQLSAYADQRHGCKKVEKESLIGVMGNGGEAWQVCASWRSLKWGAVKT